MFWSNAKRKVSVLLVSLALGPAGRDTKLALAISSVLHPGFRHTLLTNGASEKLALEIESDIVEALLDAALEDGVKRRPVLRTKATA